MSYPIKILHLQKSELQYEVVIRGEIPASTVLELRRQVCKLTQLYQPDDVADSCLDFSDDIKGILDSLNKIKINLETLQTEFDDNLSDRTRSLLNHIYYRLRRIIQPDNPENLMQLKATRKSFDDFYHQFSKITKPVGSTKDFEGTPTTIDKNISSLDSLNLNVQCDRGLSSDISKLKFDGTTCVRSFIQRLEEFRIAKKISDEKLMAFAYEIFVGDALHWFRAVKNNISSCEGLINRLHEDFDVFDYDYRMITEIRDRTQGESENITIYLCIMKGMFSRLGTPMSEKDQLDILLHNIRPCYANLLAGRAGVSSIEELQDLCRNYEKVKTRCRNFKEPLAATSKTLAPEFAYKTSGKYYSKNFNSNSKLYSNNNFNNKVSAISQPKFCVRCRVYTHSMRECPAERIIFCFKCGKKDVRSTECPNCNLTKPVTPNSKNE